MAFVLGGCLESQLATSLNCGRWASNTWHRQPVWSFGEHIPQTYDRTLVRYRTAGRLLCTNVVQGKSQSPRAQFVRVAVLLIEVVLCAPV